MPRRVDENQKEIVSIFRKLGMKVLILSEVGKGCPDLALGYKGSNYFIEIKNGKKPPSAQKLTPHEQEFFDTWSGQVCIINSTEKALEFFEKIQQKN